MVVDEVGEPKIRFAADWIAPENCKVGRSLSTGQDWESWEKARWRVDGVGGIVGERSGEVVVDGEEG